MARKDILFESFMNHPLVIEQLKDAPKSLKEGLESENLIVGTIATFVETLASNSQISDEDLKKRINTYLNAKIS